MAGKPRGRSFTSESAKEANAKIQNHRGVLPLSNANAVTANAEVVSATIGNTMYRFDKPKPKSDEEVLERIQEFFERCEATGEYPTLEKLCVALGVTRKTVWMWEGGSMGTARAIYIQQAKETLAAIDSDLVVQGKMNPVPYIFRSKVHYGMRENGIIEEYQKPAEPEPDMVESIAQKYIEGLPMIEG